ncbi:PEP-CTERM sorting domain-containing protein [Luteolibacter flavescens]|uniref:PEP-CTERM sorting domain-containing protein n=1 Tax=Luteolibacter flavescens TaxID=1859460 RepID=A0ABT3FPI3_9BACT|nr:PEP-CTERM sorting domain-containing protein [Luteolibacter flavescens]MCW1885467.1 PEP-CTERM sorting domain-containing protein [Luteolibacter flavescens]
MKFILTFAAIFGLCHAASAAVVVTIDISSPGAVVITTVGAGSSSTGDLTVNFAGGISFLGFFTDNELITAEEPALISGNWRASGTSTSYNEMVTFEYGSPDVVPGVDLSIYNLGAVLSDDQNFVLGQQAFFGSSVVDFSSLTHLPAVGTTGNVMLGYRSSHGGVIGQWEVIPEPTTALLGLLGMGAFAARRRR